VQFIIKRDKKGRFCFASIQSEYGRTQLLKFQINTAKIDSIVLIDKERAYTRSTAALRIARQLQGAWPVLYGFIIIPSFIRDMAYDFIAKHRYRWFGKKDSCMIPGQELKSRFLG